MKRHGMKSKSPLKKSKLILCFALILVSILIPFQQVNIASADSDDPVSIAQKNVNKYMAWRKLQACADAYGKYSGDSWTKLDDTSSQYYRSGWWEAKGSDITYFDMDNYKTGAKCNIDELAKSAGLGDNWLETYITNNLGDRTNGKVKIVSNCGYQDTYDGIKQSINSNDKKCVRVNFSFMKDVLNSIKEPSIGGVEWYLIWQNGLSRCGKIVEGSAGDPSVRIPTIDSKTKRIPTNGVEGKISPFNSGMNAGAAVTVFPGPNSHTDASCRDIAKESDNNVQAYIDAWNNYLDKHPDKADDPTTKPETGGNSTTNPSSGADETQSTCNIDGVGWFICPIINFLGGAADVMYKIIDGLLQIKSSDLFSTTGPAYTAYQKFLPIANIILALMFLAIIYSEATGSGFGLLSNYSIKKMLPRLIIFAILLNLSWFICAIAVDLSNIVGANARSLFSGISSGLSAPAGGGSWETIAGQILVGSAGVGATVIAISAAGGAAILLPVLMLIVVTLLTTFLILTARQAGVVLFCVVSPVALAMGMLPNTEKIFQKWRNWFITLLMVYPVTSVIFGASDLAGKVLMQTHVTDITSWSMQVAGSLMQVIPLIAVPLYIASSLKSVGPLGAALGGFAAGRLSKSTGKVNEKRKQGWSDSAARRGLTGAKSWAAGKAVNSRIGQSGLGRSLIQTPAMIAAAGAAGAIDADRDKRYMESAGNLIGGLSSDQQRAIATTGSYKDKNNNTRTANQYMIRAAQDAQAESLGAGDVHDMLKNAKATGNQDVIKSAAAAAKKSGSALMSGGDLANYINGTKQWSGSNFEKSYRDSVSGFAKSKLSSDSLSQMSAGDINYLKDYIGKGSDKEAASSTMAALGQTASNVTARQMAQAGPATQQAINQIKKDYQASQKDRMDNATDKVLRASSSSNFINSANALNGVGQSNTGLGFYKDGKAPQSILDSSQGIQLSAENKEAIDNALNNSNPYGTSTIEVNHNRDNNGGETTSTLNTAAPTLTTQQTNSEQAAQKLYYTGNPMDTKPRNIDLKNSNQTDYNRAAEDFRKNNGPRH